MERYLDKLKDASQPELFKEINVKKEREKISAQNPCVACSVTMGKEPHAGHLFLLTIAEQMQSALNSKVPLIIINNNTGPRAAGALIDFARNRKLSLREGAELLNSGEVDTGSVVSSYRNRKNNSLEEAQAVEVLSSNNYDIFSTIARETEGLLKLSGFNAQVVSEAQLLHLSKERTKSINEEWVGTGFTPFIVDKRIVILQKAGNLTATGTLFTSICTLAEGLETDLMVMVDSMPDASDAGFVFSNTSIRRSSAQVPGAGVGFGGEIASGTKGEALTIKEIAKSFYSERPKGDLKLASLFLTLTRPVSLPKNSMNLGDSFFDFQNNESMIQLLIKCNDESAAYRQSIMARLDSLQKKISDISFSPDKTVQKMFQFLPQKLQSLLGDDPERILSTSKKVEIVSADEALTYSKELGYQQNQDNPYLSNKRSLGFRKNYYFNNLSAILNTTEKIEKIREEDLVIICEMIQFSMERIGI